MINRLSFSFYTLLLFCTLFCHGQKSQAPVYGTWVTNVASNALRTKKDIRETVQLCKSYGLNTLYVVVWNKGVTMYPSDVVERYIGIKQDSVYKGFDPIKEVITEGHKAGLKIFAWFEYGFAYDYNDTNSVWLKKYPHWAGRDAKGQLLQKNKFYWWNSLHPEVQQFMTSLVLEVVKKYNVDGVQGDDRLPAMPSEGGYDSYTKQLYAAEHNNALPPDNAKDETWVQWRADKLSQYIKGLYADVKKVKKQCVVSWAPSIYPWSKEQYLQDWPAWLKGGYADQVLPQLYRYDIVAYEKVLKELSEQVPPGMKQKVFPGILTSLGDGYRIKQEMLTQIIKLNRKYGFKGESTFYFEGTKSLKPYYISANNAVKP
ncbi:glycoside hydrolase family 10 protein [Flavisolibacter tropicus]|uniref:Glycosyl hydrolase-like 10 domain-containing protein n=1 Tax=Flavisolibacter tropicus TaxID=1492898 RepID=A0A172TTA2_9BACT|nr:family 10 glycosylhydrolase [Flavisolibacter tropicus]ANE49987.1 hypothetical protein SY85_05235 [Flavisolibacter tropicus]